MPEAVIDRPLRGEDDVMAIRAFLSKMYRRTGTGLNWEIRRWEGQFWHDDVAIAHLPTSRLERVHLWQSRTGRILGAVTPEGGGDAHLQIDPNHRDLEPELLTWAEEHLAVGRGGGRHLTTYALAGDDMRGSLLRSRGYAVQPWGSVQRWRDLTRPLPWVNPKKKYTIRSVRAGDRNDLAALTQLINAAFGHDFAPDALARFEESPSYNPDLQMVAERGGVIVSHVGVTIDEASQLAIVEPVCTHPSWSRKGLATAVMATGLERAVALGATRAVVGTGIDNPSNNVYSKLGFDDVEVVHTWQRTWR